LVGATDRRFIAASVISIPNDPVGSEYLATLDDAAYGAATSVIPKFVSPSDPAAQWTGALRDAAWCPGPCGLWGYVGTPHLWLTRSSRRSEVPVHVKRLVASIVLAARLNGLSNSRGRDCAVNCARMYREHMRKFSKLAPLQIWYAETSAADFGANDPLIFLP
jgi:hypothetical protein